MMISIVLLKVDFGSMAKHEANAAKGDLFTTGQKTYKEEEQVEEKRGKVCDLVVPVVTLIICCIIGMIYTGGFLKEQALLRHFLKVMLQLDLLRKYFALMILLYFML